MDDDELWRRTPTRTSAKTEDAFYEEAMDQEYDTTREGHGADDNAEETYYQSDELRGDYDEAMEEPTWTQGANSPIFVLPKGTSALWHLLLMQLLVVQQLNSQFLLAARRHNAQVNFERKFIDVHPLQCLGQLKEEHHEDNLECPHHRLYSGDGLLSKTFSRPMDGMCAVLTSPMDGILRRQLTDVPSMNYKILNALTSVGLRPHARSGQLSRT